MTDMTKDEFYLGLSSEGEAKVKAKLITGFYGDAGYKKALVEEWLNMSKEARLNAREAFRDSMLIEQANILKGTKRVETIATIAAIASAISALCSAIVSFLVFMSNK